MQNVRDSRRLLLDDSNDFAFESALRRQLGGACLPLSVGNCIVLIQRSITYFLRRLDRNLAERLYDRWFRGRFDEWIAEIHLSQLLQVVRF